MADDRFQPDLSGLTSLELTWNHGLNEEPSNVGLSYLYSISNTGHLHVVACVLPGVEPVDHPVAVVDEGGYTVEVIASSIASWLPCYLVRFATDALHSTWLGRMKGWPLVDWREKQIELLLAQEAELRAALAGFRSPGVDHAVEEVLESLRQRHTLDPARWRPDELYTAVEPDGCVSAYQRLAATQDGDVRPLIAAHPTYNKPLYAQFARNRRRSSDLDSPELYRAFHAVEDQTVHDRDVSLDLAHEVFHRRTGHDANGIFENDLLDRAAGLLARSAYPVDEPLSELISNVAEHSVREVELGDPWFEAGQRWEAAGNPAQAVVCYENALHWHAADNDDEWHVPAGRRMLAVAVDLHDEHYLAYLVEALRYMED